LIPVEQSSPPYNIVDYYENAIHFSIFHLSESTIRNYIGSYLRFKPEFVKGYPSALYEFSKLVERAGVTLPAVKAVYCASEVLHDFQKEVIERAFGAKIFQWYGQVETTVNLHQCGNGRIHVKETYGYLELLDLQGNDVMPGETGQVIGTSWGNLAFPLLRYDTGDRMKLALDQHCTCGMNGRIVESILGRDEDVIVTPDGRRLGRLDFLFKPIKNVEESQIVQESSSTLHVRVVPTESYSEADEQLIRNMICEYIGTGMNVTIEECTSIPREKGGKLRYVISKVI
jgi:phenylacetate-CoA ligase